MTTAWLRWMCRLAPLFARSWLIGFAVASLAPGAHAVDGGALAHSPTMARRAPAGVPAGFVVTPFGYFHPSCVRAIAPGESLLADGSIRRDDEHDATPPVCRYPHYAADGTRLDGSALPARARPGRAARAESASPLPAVDGWLEAGWYVADAAFSGIAAKWIVPPPPAADVGQVLYFFPGLEDATNIRTILQPVLGWNGYDDHTWSIASWNCCVSGIANHSQPVSVETGALIGGVIRGNCPAGSVCPTWDIVTTDTTTGRRTLLKGTSGYRQIFDWAFAGAVEVYGVYACDQYPASGFIDFTDVFLYGIDKRQMHGVPWVSSNLLAQDPPPCSYGVNTAPYGASLTF